MSIASTVTTFTGTYSADPDHSSVSFAVRHMGISIFRSSFSDVTAAVVVGDDGALKLTGATPVRSISIVSPVELRDHLLSEDFFDAERHPDIFFESDPVQLGEDGQLTVDGRLTIRNITRAVVATGTYATPVEDPYGNMRAAVELTTTIDRRDYGMSWNAPMPNGEDALGTLVTLTVHLELIGD